MRNLRVVPLLISLGAVLTAVHAAPVPQAASQAPTDPVVVEIRALRADLNQRLDASIRAQLMVSRLSMQEQRMQTVIRQLSEVQDKLKANETSRGQLEGGLKMLGFDKLTDKEKEEISPVFGGLIAGREKIDKVDADLRMQLSDLTTLLNQEQARWNSFNRMLDEIEAALAKPVK
jgi:hypothetical protein